MISDTDACFVWIWLPGQIEPVAAGHLQRDGEQLVFNYGRSYLDRPDAIPIYLPELPLKPGLQLPRGGAKMASCLRDASPDAWGRRVILNRKTGARKKAIDIGALDELTYLLESGSDRTGALDFQLSSNSYTARTTEVATLEQLQAAAASVEAGIPISPALHAALLHGSSIGGARPKAQIETKAAKYIAKFSSSNDPFNVVKGEFVAMQLAKFAGLDVAHTELDSAGGKDVLLVRRFDRNPTPLGWTRQAVVSALTLLDLDEMEARYASYEDLCEIIRLRFEAPKETLRELFGRLVFNIVCGNTDDHARNHAAFWTGDRLSLTPAYDICPQSRGGNIAGQAMLILGNANRSVLELCLKAAPNFRLTAKQAIELVEAQLLSVRRHFKSVADQARLTETDRVLLATRQFFNPSIFDGAPSSIARLGAERLA